MERAESLALLQAMRVAVSPLVITDFAVSDFVYYPAGIFSTAREAFINVAHSDGSRMNIEDDQGTVARDAVASNAAPRQSEQSS
jgi:hypothetical protein